MNFIKYPSIENSYREKEIQKIKENIYPNKKFVVLEKVHGCNFSFIIDKNRNIITAKRTSILKDENFYNSDIIKEKYQEKVLKLANEYFKTFTNVKQVQIYGELFGGLYNNKSDKNSKKIQKEVQYIPFNDFIIYDIAVDTTDTTDNTKKGQYFRNFIDWDTVKKLCDKYDIKHVPELFRGTLDECLEYPNIYITKIPDLYGLEPIDGNICEGNVIKTIKDIRIGKLKERVILKNKNDKFKEKSKSKKSKKITTKITDEQKKYVEEITKYFTKSRLDGLFSKGEVQKDWKQFGKIQGLFFKDVQEDFIKDNPKFLEQDKKIINFIFKLAQNEGIKFIREILKKEI